MNNSIFMILVTMSNVQDGMVYCALILVHIRKHTISKAPKGSEQSELSLFSVQYEVHNVN